MEFNEIRQKVREALQEVLTNDRHLLIHNINEPAISHRLAVYLEPKFHGFHIDCEYNGNVDSDRERKYIQFLYSKAVELGKVAVIEGGENREFVNRDVFPDIIVHRRGLNGNQNNLLIIEIKKSSNPDQGDWDIEKLSRFTSNEYDNNFNYQYGVFVRFVVEQNPDSLPDPSSDYSMRWYRNGNEISE